MTSSASRCSSTTTARAVNRQGACCAGRDIGDARRVAETLGFPHYVLDYESRFREAVIDEFADQYLAGATPIPCVRCNQSVKFRDLLETARELGADCLATGHYIQRREGRAGPSCTAPPIRPATSPISCSPPRASSSTSCAFRSATCAPRPRRARWPPASASPSPTSRTARTSASCPRGGYAAVIEKLRPGAAEPGEIVDLAGRVLGHHPGIIHYTVGQRRGLGIGGVAGSRRGRRRAALRPAPRARDAPRRRRAARGARHADAPCRRHQLAGRRPLRRRPPRWPRGARQGALDPPAGAGPHPPAPARPDDIANAPPAAAEVELLAPEEGVAPGQACVFYAPDGSRILGGGWIHA